jgi:hypothetical protein
MGGYQEGVPWREPFVDAGLVSGCSSGIDSSPSRLKREHCSDQRQAVLFPVPPAGPYPLGFISSSNGS